MTRLDDAVLRLWLDGETATTLLRHAGRLGCTIASEADLERLADAAEIDWRTVRGAARQRRSDDNLRLAMTLSDAELVDLALSSHGRLSADAMRILEEAARG